MKLNKTKHIKKYTHEGGQAANINPEQQLRRSLMACLLWEKGFYESGESIADRIVDIIPRVKPEKVAAMAVEARTQMKLRHAPLLVVRGMARYPEYKSYVADTLYQVIQRADELAEFLSIYWKDGRCPLSAQVKKGLARAFTKFDSYQLAKYDRKGDIKLKDVLFLCHAKPKDEGQADTWKQLVNGTLPTPDTWEVALSAGNDKRVAWTRLIEENKLGGMAFLRNLRNMYEAGVDENLVFEGLDRMRTGRILPYRFIAAAQHVPQWEPEIEEVMLRCTENLPKLPGKTVLLVDVSGSMNERLSSKSDLTRMDAANGLAILAREMCEHVVIYSFSMALRQIPSRRGFALRDAIAHSQEHSGTPLGLAVQSIYESRDWKISSIDIHYGRYSVDYRGQNLKPDRLIVVTDEQSTDRVPDPVHGKGYMINVASYKNGVGYGAWQHIDGFSEAVLDYIRGCEEMS